MKGKASKSLHGNFAFRIRIGDCEIQIDGNREEVLKTIEDMPMLIGKVYEAFEIARPKKVTTLTVKTEPSKEEKMVPQIYPKIIRTENLEEAILKLLETDWGKWRPRTISELGEALKANGLQYSGQKLARTLMSFVKKERVRRWKTDSGDVYILAEKETSK